MDLRDLCGHDSMAFVEIPKSGRSQMGCKSGPHKILTDEQEECLVGFLVRCATIGYAKSRIEVMALIDQIYKSRGIDKSVTNGWWESFCKRHHTTGCIILIQSKNYSIRSIFFISVL